jgi:hypothetical protein
MLREKSNAKMRRRVPPISWEKKTTVRALPRREANPPAKSPAPQERALVRPQMMDMDSAGIID